jgi:hypothetical protein
VSRPIPEPLLWPDEAKEAVWRRCWAVFMLTADLNVARSILEGRRVLARQLDAVALRRALRGAPLPPPGEYVLITNPQLDAVAEGGAFCPEGKARR